MAHSTLPALPPLSFPQVFSPATAEVFLPRRRFDAPIYCENELPEFGGEVCARVAVVTSLETEQSLCMGCFRG